MKRAALCLALLGCGGPAEVAICVRTAIDDDPLGRASEVVVQALPAEGPRVVESFRGGVRDLRMPELPFGSYVFSIDALGDEGQTVAFGISTFADVTATTRSTPCLYLASVDRFGRPAVEPPAEPRGLVVTEPERTAAMILTAEGLVRYDHLTGRFDRAQVRGTAPEADSIWVALASSRALALQPDGTAVVLENGAFRSVALAGFPGALVGASAMAVGFSRVLVVGGAPSEDEPPSPTGSLRIVDVERRAVEPLEGEVPVVDARLDALGNGQLLVTGGNEGSRASPLASSRVVVIDPDDGVVEESTLDVPRYEHATVLVADNILVLGGLTGPDSFTGSIERLRLSGGALVHLAAPRGLLVPRAGHVAIEAGDDVLVVGGATEDANAATTTERFRFALDGTELDADTGAPLDRPVATELYDGTALVIGGGPDGPRALVYRPDPPR